MAISIQEKFTSNFHSLDGITIGEKRKNLFLLLKKTKDKLRDASQFDFSSIEPKTPLEENFKVESMLYFQKIPDLLQVLKGGHPILIGKTLTPWFVKEAIGKMTGKELLELFPHLSYVTKLKLLHKLSLHLNDTNKIDEFFGVVDEKYGKYLASQLISGCSKELILHTITENDVEVSAKQMLIICKKYPEDTEIFFEKVEQQKSSRPVNEKYEIVFRYLAQHNPQLFLKLNEKYKVDFRLGHRATATFISKEKENIIKDPKKFFKFLNREEFGRGLKDNLNDVYPKIFPNSLKQLSDDLWEQLDLLKFLKSDSKKLEMIAESFKAKHGSELWDHPKFFTAHLITKMSPERREIWMKNRTKPDDISEAEWTSFMKTEKSIPQLKQKIELTSSIKDRASLLRNLVLTCAWNRDKEALVEMCKYAVSKHRNDNSTVREEFLASLDDAIDYFEVSEFSQDFWKMVQDFINLSKLKGGCGWSAKRLSEKNILYCMENNLPIKDLLLEFVKFENTYYNLCEKNIKYEKEILLMFSEVLPLVFKGDELKSQYVDYISAVERWNGNHPKQKIPVFLFTDAMKAVMENLEKESYPYDAQRIARYCIRNETESALRADLFPMLFKSHNYSYDSGLTNVIWNHPFLLKQYAEEIFKFQKEMYDRDQLFKTNMYSYYPYLGIPQKIASLCKGALDDLSGNKLKDPALGLSKVLPTEEFLNLPLFNKDLNMDLESKEGQKLYAQRQALFPNLRYVLPPSKALDTVLKFSDKEYLHLTQKALQVIVLNVPEKEVLTFLKSLAERSVSAKKHAIFLGFKVLDKNTSRDMIIETTKKETNPSIRKTLFRTIFSYFVSNPDEHTWEMVKNSASSFQPQDKEAFELLSKRRRIPSKFFVQYVTFAWDTLPKCNNSETQEEGKGRILDMVDKDTVGKIPEEFFVKAQEEIFKSEKLSDFQKKVQGFVCRYIIYSQEDKLPFIFEKLEKYVKESWRNVKHQEARKVVFNFVKEFCSHFLEKTCTNRDLLAQFITLWEGILKPCQAYQGYLHLNFTLIFVDASKGKQTIHDIAGKILNLWESLESKDLKTFLHCFKRIKEKLLTIDDVDEETNQSILVEKVAASGTVASLMLALSLFSRDESMDDRVKTAYEDIIARAVEHEDPLLQIRLDNYLVKGNNEYCYYCNN